MEGNLKKGRGRVGGGREERERERKREGGRKEEGGGEGTLSRLYVLYDVSCTCRCVIAELFMDGRPLFDLSQLLDYYHKEKEATEATLKKIPDRFIRVRKEPPYTVDCRWLCRFGLVKVAKRRDIIHVS